jgi:hypothetical protein
MEEFQQIRIKFILFIFFSFHFLFAHCQVYSEGQINALAKEVNRQMVGIDIGNGVIGRGCKSEGRTIIYQYDVPDGWEPFHNVKELLIANLTERGLAKLYLQQKINANFNYYRGNNLVKSIHIAFRDFDSIDESLKEYPKLDNYFDAKGHPKSKEVNFKIKVPNGWEVFEGERPNVVKKFIKDGNVYLILIKDNATFFSRKQAKEALMEANFAKDIIDDACSIILSPEIIEQSVVTVDTYPTLYLKIKGEIESAGISSSRVLSSWIVFYEDKLVFLQGHRDNNKNQDKYDLIFTMITNSAIFPDQYE